MPASSFSGHTRVALLAGTLAVALGVGSELGLAAAGGGCPPAGTHPVASRGAVRVFSAGSSGRVGFSSAPTYACLVGRASRTPLGGGPRQRVANVAIAGRMVAFSLTASGVDTSQTQVQVVDLGRGAKRGFNAATAPTRPESFISVTALVVIARGSVAWIASRGGVGQATTFEVRRAAGGHVSLLDSGSAIAPSSLRLSGHAMSWQDRGRRRTALLG